MIEVNAIIPPDECKFIDELRSADFCIIVKNKISVGVYYHLRLTEEDYTVLRIKYGKKNVWLR